MDLVVHCAGPFQGKDTCAVLEAAIAAGTPYVDVCDDAEYSKVRWGGPQFQWFRTCFGPFFQVHSILEP